MSEIKTNTEEESCDGEPTIGWYKAQFEELQDCRKVMYAEVFSNKEKTNPKDEYFPDKIKRVFKQLQKKLKVAESLLQSIGFRGGYIDEHDEMRKALEATVTEWESRGKIKYGEVGAPCSMFMVNNALKGGTICPDQKT